VSWGILKKWLLFSLFEGDIRRILMRDTETLRFLRPLLLCQLNNDCIVEVAFKKVMVSLRYRLKSHRQSFIA
jgi:hypothetical protein